MALTRKALSAMGIESDKIDEIISGHSETVNALNAKIDEAKAEADRYKAEAEKVEQLQKDKADLSKQVESLEKQIKTNDYDTLKKEFEDYKAEVARKEVRSQKEAAYKEILKDAGVPEKHYAKILKYSDVDGVELDDSGKITTAKELLKEIKAEWGDHIETKTTEGVKTETPPTSGGTASGKTRDEIMAIKDRAERQKAISENHELFGY